MGCLPLTLRTWGILLLTRIVLPVLRQAAQDTLSQAREHYHRDRGGRVLGPRVSRLDPAVLSWRVPFVPTGRLQRRLVAARPMGP
jgi:hypothetical protein